MFSLCPTKPSRSEAATTETREAPRRVLAPRTDIYEADDRFVLVAEVPGVGPEQVDIRIDRNVLTIHAEAQLNADERLAPVWREFPAVTWERRFTLSEAIDQAGVQAVVKDGVLRLDLPKSVQARPRRIPVTAA